MLLEEGYEVVAGFAEVRDGGLVYMCHCTVKRIKRVWIGGAIDLDGNWNVNVNECIRTYLDTGTDIQLLLPLLKPVRRRDSM